MYFTLCLLYTSLSNGDPIGSVTILPPEGKVLSDLEIKTAELGAGFLAKQMEN